MRGVGSECFIERTRAEWPRIVVSLFHIPDRDLVSKDTDLALDRGQTRVDLFAAPGSGVGMRIQVGCRGIVSFSRRFRSTPRIEMTTA